jgi:NADPH:quinone reductase-like Zn-dependent oxidoreductase
LFSNATCTTRYDSEASAIPFAALTAWRALFTAGGLKPGERVLIMGGGSSVGTAAAQLALARGCQVAATCGPRSRARLASLAGLGTRHSRGVSDWFVHGPY